MATVTSTFTIDARITGEGIVFLYQVLADRVSGIHTINLSKTTDGAPLTKSFWLPPSANQYYVAFSYDGTNFDNDIEIMPNTQYHFSVAARAVRITIP